MSAASSGIFNPTWFAKSSLSTRMVWRMIRSRSRPPPRGPLRISGETRPLLHDLQGAASVEVARQSSEVRDRPIALPIRLERLDGGLGGLGAPIPPGPVEGEGHRSLVLRSAFDHRANGHSCSIAFDSTHSRAESGGWAGRDHRSPGPGNGEATRSLTLPCAASNAVKCREHPHYAKAVAIRQSWLAFGQLLTYSCL